MRVGGLGEFENIRKAVQKEDAGKSPSSAQKPAEGGASTARGEDVVEITSPEFKRMAKLHSLPDVRTEKIEQIRQKMEDGTLMNDEAVQDGIKKFLGEIL